MPRTSRRRWSAQRAAHGIDGSAPRVLLLQARTVPGDITLDRDFGRHQSNRRKERVVALVVLVLLLAILGGLGFAVHVLWYVLIFAVLLWLIGFFVGGGAGGGRRWYGRW
jgi:uncharacterized membrane protein YecN with MAPEG domain